MIKAADQFHTKTARPNEMWQTDSIYFKIIGWGWMYLSTVLDDLSRYVIAWKLYTSMRAEMQVRVHCLAFGGVDLTSAADKITMSVIASVAEFERDLLVEWSQAGLTHTKSQSKKLGRPTGLSLEHQDAVRNRRKQGASLGVLVKEFGVSRSAIQRVRYDV